MMAFSLGKRVVSLPLGSSSSSVPHVRDPEITKLLIMARSLNLCLMGYAWFGQASSTSPIKWYIGGLTRFLSQLAVVETCLKLEPPASSLLPSVVVVVP
jgi:hypothetical protein